MDKKNMRKVATIQARMGSSRLPGKILLPLAGQPSLSRMVERIRRSRWVDDIVVATTVNATDDAAESWAREAGVHCFRGSEEDVLSRVLGAAVKYDADILVQLTGDCPLIDPAIIDELMEYYLSGDFDYVSNILERSYPRGLDTQIFSRQVLRKVSDLTQDPHDREHVSLYIYEHPKVFRLGGIKAPAELFAPEIRICVDTDEDYKLVSFLYDRLYLKNPHFSSRDILNCLREHPEMAAINRHIRQKAAR